MDNTGNVRGYANTVQLLHYYVEAKPGYPAQKDLNKIQFVEIKFQEVQEIQCCTILGKQK